MSTQDDFDALMNASNSDADSRNFLPLKITPQAHVAMANQLLAHVDEKAQAGKDALLWEIDRLRGLLDEAGVDWR